MFHLFADVRIGDVQEKQDWKKKNLNSMQENYWRARCDCGKDGHRRNGSIPYGRWCLPLSTAANPHLPRALGTAPVHLEAQTTLSNAVQQRSFV